MVRPFGWLRAEKGSLLHGFQITWSGLALSDGSGRKGVTVVVWVEAALSAEARSLAVGHAEEGLEGLVTAPISVPPEVDDLGNRRTVVDLPKTGPGLWRTGYVFFPADSQT